MREMLIQLDVDAGDRRWQERANCLGVDPDLFFPERGASTKEAKAVCGGCEVKSECLEYALRHGEKFGIWGGMSERERRRFRTPGARSLDHAGLDRAGGVDIGPPQELVRAAVQLEARDQPDDLDRRDVSALPACEV